METTRKRRKKDNIDIKHHFENDDIVKSRTLRKQSIYLLKRRVNTKREQFCEKKRHVS